MSPPRNGLSKRLRELAAASPQGAPPEVGARVKDAFARHHMRRRRRRMVLAAGLAACLAVSLAWWASRKQPRPAAANEPSRTLQVQPAEAPAVATKANDVKPGTRSKRKSRRARSVAPPPAVASADFVALPSFDPAVPIGPARIVRVEMPGSALQLVGYPVDEELLQRRVVTDMVVGQDGLPYAVRLVQTRSNH